MIMTMRIWEDIENYTDFLGQIGYTVSFSCFKNKFTFLTTELLRHDFHPHPICTYLKANGKTKGCCVKNKRYLGGREWKEPRYDCCFAGVEEYVFPVIYEGEFLLYIHVSGYRGGLARSERRKEKTALKCGARFSELYAQLSDNIPAMKTVESFIRPLYHMFVRLYLDVQEVPFGEDSVIRSVYSKTMEYIHENYMYDLSCDVIARDLLYSTSHLRFLFKKAAGVSLHAKISEVRMENACKLLLAGGFSVTEIAQCCGFSDSNYFSALFKKTYGVPPTAYKKAFERKRKPAD